MGEDQTASALLRSQFNLRDRLAMAALALFWPEKLAMVFLGDTPGETYRRIHEASKPDQAAPQ